MADKIKKVVRSLSTRKPQPSKIETGPASLSVTKLEQYPQKSPLTSPIPPNTVIYFPQCPHTTPPTPRPAQLPTVLRTELVQTSPIMNPAAEAHLAAELIIPAGLETPPRAAYATGPLAQVRRFLVKPERCLDCTLSQAHEQTSWINDRYDAVTREAKLHRVEHSSGIRAFYDTAAQKLNAGGNLSAENDKTLQTIYTEMGALDEKVRSEREKRDHDIRMVWDSVRKDWEGGVREIVRDNGTGEAEERCVFVFPWEDVPVEDPRAEEGAEGVFGVLVRWVSMKR